RRHRRIGTLAQHRVAPCIDAVDRAAKPGPPQVTERPAGCLCDIVGLPDDRHRAGRQQRLAQGSSVRRHQHADYAERNGEGGSSDICRNLPWCRNPSVPRPYMFRVISFSRQRAHWRNSNSPLRLLISPYGRSTARHIEGVSMLKSGVLPIATALVGVGVFALATQVRAGGDLVKFPEAYDKGVLFTTVDRADNKQYREVYTSPAAIDAAKKGQPLPDGTV